MCSVAAKTGQNAQIEQQNNVPVAYLMSPKVRQSFSKPALLPREEDFRSSSKTLAIRRELQAKGEAMKKAHRLSERWASKG